ncbi:hypothetical protein E1B28_006612 [Marasmius oreades]|uniref:Non-reducing end beta-L-arabinofuranosidase-like GH127 middle domain-containing protein n=1 Tax=Marasmius oreades TaxID=181124 RepID=A0A9P7UWH3_9AGAR|nr:uncharacterized protein E1B28_006612 [Marasmius oreades]KAG7095929.1 hypothetical protein E1B28_006612 [Marasmius oreades]
MKRAIFATVVLGAVLEHQLQAKLAPKAFEPLPLGTIWPAGWLYDQLQVQTDGVAGHMHEFYPLVANTDWTGGDSYYSYLEEAGSYWFNAMVPNGILMNHTVIKKKSREFLDYVLDNQDFTGWLGPEVGTEKPRYLWGRYPFFFGAIQMVEYHTELTDRVVTALHKFVRLANTMLRNGEGVDKWAETRWEDFVVTLQWLHDKHPRGQEDLLVDTMRRLKWSGTPWEKVFSRDLFPKGPVEQIPNPFGKDLYWHGVNMAEGLKALPATYRFTLNTSDLEAATLSWDLLFKYHGRPSGAFGADELLSGLEANRGSELCLVVEAMFSGSYLYQVIGDLKFADRVERMTYNALPATITSNMWGRQYLQQQNQVAAKNMTPNPFPEDGPESNIFGLEPNYPCCTVNFPQGWPKFITNAFLATPDKKSLVHLYLGPFSARLMLADDNAVSVSVETLYPFGDILNYQIRAEKDFTFYVRIPSWVSGGSLSVNGDAKQRFSPNENGLQKVDLKKGATTLVLEVPAEITVGMYPRLSSSPNVVVDCQMAEYRPHGSVALHRGPLNYAFDIARTEKVLKVNPDEPYAVDLEYDPAGVWEYAIDPSQLSFHYNPPEGNVLPSPVFDSGKTPMSITATACHIEWPLGGDMFTSNPPKNPECIGENTVITLEPLGATKLRISEFPVFNASKNGVEGATNSRAQVPLKL